LPYLMRDSSFIAMSIRSPSSRKSKVTRESPGQARTRYATVEEAEDGSKFFLVMYYIRMQITPFSHVMSCIYVHS
jgi:hypothetical protein